MEYLQQGVEGEGEGREYDWKEGTDQEEKANT